MEQYVVEVESFFTLCQPHILQVSSTTNHSIQHGFIVSKPELCADSSLSSAHVFSFFFLVVNIKYALLNIIHLTKLKVVEVYVVVSFERLEAVKEKFYVNVIFECMQFLIILKRFIEIKYTIIKVHT